MGRMITTKAVVGTSRGEGPQFSEEEKAAYRAKWETFARKMGNRPIKGTRDFKARVVSISDPREEENTYPGNPPGTMRTVRDIMVELLEAGVEGLHFMCNTADNVQNEKTRLYQLYTAVHGKTPPPKYESFTYDLDALIGPAVTVTIEKGGERTDGKRGGLYANAIRFSGWYEDADTPPAKPTRVTKTKPVEAADDEELPF